MVFDGMVLCFESAGRSNGVNVRWLNLQKTRAYRNIKGRQLVYTLDMSGF